MCLPCGLRKRAYSYNTYLKSDNLTLDTHRSSTILHFPPHLKKQDGRVEGGALNFSCKNLKIATNLG